MASSTSEPARDPADDEELAELLGQLGSELLTGPEADVSALIRAHPEHADRLRRLLPTLQHMARLAQAESTPSEALRLPAVAGFTLVREIGRGGMGVVYEAVQQPLGRRVALKVLPPALRTPLLLERFHREAEAAARLHHANIVPVYGFGRDHDLSYYVMHLVEGEPLQRALSHGAADRYRRVAELGAQAAEGLHHAHQRSVLHRDVKPANLLLDASGTVQITDFGLAHVEGAGDLTHTGDLVGTLRYMAPERFAGEADARSDVYSLGLTLYELLAGRPAFPQPERAAIMQEVLHGPPPAPLRRLDPGMPRDLETIILKAMDRERQRRYPTAAELAADLRRFLADQPIQARRAAPWEHAWRWARRNPALAGTAALAALAVLGTLFTLAVSVVVVSQSRNAERRARERIARDAAQLYFDKAHRQCQEEDAAAGLLALVEALRRAEAAGEEDLARTIRLHVGAWAPEVGRLQSAVVLPVPVTLAALAPGGARLATAAPDQPARLWGPLTGKAIAETLRHEGGVTVLAFSPDGQTLATAGADRTVRLWDAETGQPLGEPLRLPEPAHGVAISSRRDRLLSCGTNQCVLWEPHGWRQIAELPTPAYNGPFHRAVFSSDGKVLLAGSERGAIQLFDASTGKFTRFRRGSGDNRVAALALGPDGESLAVAGEGGPLRLYEARVSPTDWFTLVAHDAALNDIAIAADGQSVLTACDDGKVRLWGFNLSPHPIVPPLHHTAPVLAATFVAGLPGRVVTAAADGTVRVWQLSLPLPLVAPLRREARLHQATFTPDGKQVFAACEDGKVHFWEATTGKSTEPPLVDTVPLTLAACSPDGRTILTGTRNGVVRLWDRETRKSLHAFSGKGLVTAALSPDGRTILTITSTEGVRLWDTATGEQRSRDIPVGRAQLAAFGAGGRVLAVAARESPAQVYDLETGRLLGQSPAHGGALSGLAASRDGKRFVSAGQDRAIRLWDALTGAAVGEALRPALLTNHVDLAPDGKLVLSATGSRAVLWDLSCGRALGPARTTFTGIHQKSIESLSFSPDGASFVATYGDGTAWLWRVPRPALAPTDALARWVEAATGLQLDDHGQLRPLSPSAWQGKRQGMKDQVNKAPSR